MITKIVKVPKNETYEFCKRILSTINGSKYMTYVDTLELIGWVGYPYNANNEDLNLLLFANNIDSLNKVYLMEYSVEYTYKIIITDVEFDDTQFEVSDIIDISLLNDYYQTELSLGDFIERIFTEKVPLVID